MLKKYYINTYGCQMNVHESEKLAGILESRGYERTDEQSNADVIVFNTCCVRETAETRVLGNLGIVKKIKENNPSLVVAVCGCMAQKPGAAAALKKRCPFINIVFGTHNLHEFGEYLDGIQSGGYRCEVWEKEGEIVEDVPVSRTSGVNAWVNIAYGCNNFCSYCIVPYVRGRERSRNETAVLDDVRRLVDEGYKEITLLGQYVNSYGNDLGDPHVNFASLLEKIATIDGEFRVKFMTSHPKDLSEDVVKAVASSDKLADYVHLPIQAGSDRILALMNRKYTQVDYLKRIDTIRKYIPEVGLSSDIMVGFPTETEEDFDQTLDVVRKVGYNNLFTFIYSRRSGTPADKMEQVALAVKKDRIKRLIAEQFEIGNALALGCVGKTYRVLCDEWNGGKGKGRSSCEKTIYFNCDENVYGKFVNVKVVATKNNRLKGEVVE